MNDFLIITTVLVELKQFEESQRVHAEDARLKIELDLIGKKDGMKCVCSRRVVFEALKRTHRRYFESLRTLTASGAIPFHRLISREVLWWFVCEEVSKIGSPTFSFLNCSDGTGNAGFICH
jgi:hypothetical protein